MQIYFLNIVFQITLSCIEKYENAFMSNDFRHPWQQRFIWSQA